MGIEDPRTQIGCSGKQVGATRQESEAPPLPVPQMVALNLYL